MSSSDPTPDPSPLPDVPELSAAPGPVGPVSRGWVRQTFAAFEVRNFQLYFLGQSLSLTGTWMRRTALGWLVYTLTGSAALLGLVMAMALAPTFFFSPWAGALADRLDKRVMVIWTQVLAAVVSSMLAALVAFGTPQVWQILALAFLGGIAFAFEVPPRQAFVFDMVGRDRLMNAIALNSAMVNATRMIGPAAAGLIMSVAGIAACFAIDAFSYVISAWSIYAIKLPPWRPPQQRQSQWSQFAEGFRKIFAIPNVRTALALLGLTLTFGWGFQSLLPPIVKDILKREEVVFGLLSSAFGGGAIFGALYVAARGNHSQPRKQMYGGIWSMGLALAAMTLWTNPFAIGGLIAIAGFGGVLFLSTANTLVQTSVSDDLRGRVMGFWALTFGAAMPLGSFLAGVIAEAIKPLATIRIFCAILLVSSVALFFSTPPPRLHGERAPGADAA